MPRIHYLSIALWLSAAIWPPAALADPPLLRAAAHEVDITPRRFPVNVNGGFLSKTAQAAADPLYARALAFELGPSQLMLMVVDSCMLPRELLDDVKQTVAERTHWPAERMLISATHTHSAPAAMGALGTDADPAYQHFLVPRLVECLQGAVERLQPAKVGWASLAAPDFTHCRRWILRPDKLQLDPFGLRSVHAQMHPGYQNADFIGPSGPVDPQCYLLGVRSLADEPIAVLANFSMHYVGHGGSQVSADYFGAFSRQLAKLATAGKKPPMVMMSQGTSGDLQWPDYGRPANKIGDAAFGASLAQRAFRALKTIEYRPIAKLDMAETRLSLERRVATPERLAWASKVVAGMEGRLPRDRPEVYAREQLFLREQPVRELKLQAIRIGDLGIAAIPNEVYGITGLKIKARSPLENTFVIELANGSEGYIPPPEQHALGGYTTWAARTAALEVQAEPKIVAGVLNLLEQVAQRKRRPMVDPAWSYAQLIGESQPFLYWRLNEFAGPLAIDACGTAGGGRHGKIDGLIAHYLSGPQSGSPPDAPVNRCVHFAGGGVSGPAGDLAGDGYSVDLWFWNGMPVDIRGTTGLLFARADNEGTSPTDIVGMGGREQSAGKLFFQSSADAKAQTGSTSIPLKAWHHLVLARDKQHVTIYLNGRREMTLESAAPKPGERLFFGRVGERNFEGKLDEIAVYPRALTASEAAAHFAALAPME